MLDRRLGVVDSQMHRPGLFGLKVIGGKRRPRIQALETSYSSRDYAVASYLTTIPHWIILGALSFSSASVTRIQ